MPLERQNVLSAAHDDLSTTVTSRAQSGHFGRDKARSIKFIVSHKENK